MKKEHPIIFSTPMVQAIMDGRKTMTRRVCKRQPRSDEAYKKYNDGTFNIFGADFDSADIKCPYGQVGDTLWVRETWWDMRCPLDGTHLAYWYKADDDGMRPAKWKPSIHMPRCAARILLQITDIGVERLNEISRGDCMTEGCPFQNMADGPDPRLWFTELWQSINGADSLKPNPWVWVITFKRIFP